MPLYEYECDACGERFEIIQKFSDVSEQCRKCGKGPVRRLMSAPGIQFKGSGFYITDYAKKGSGGSDGGGSTGKSDTGKSETKSDSKSESTSSDSSTKSTPATPAASTTKD
jgi:putative FmdB family regulatory protein